MNKKHFEVKTEVLICQCHSAEHLILFNYWEDTKDVYMEIHLTKLPFFKRLWYGIKYIFGYQCKYGAFDEVILKPEDYNKIGAIHSRLFKEYFKSIGKAEDINDASGLLKGEPGVDGGKIMAIKRTFSGG